MISTLSLVRQTSQIISQVDQSKNHELMLQIMDIYATPKVYLGCLELNALSEIGYDPKKYSQVLNSQKKFRMKYYNSINKALKQTNVILNNMNNSNEKIYCQIIHSYIKRASLMFEFATNMRARKLANQLKNNDIILKKKLGSVNFYNFEKILEQRPLFKKAQEEFDKLIDEE